MQPVTFNAGDYNSRRELDDDVALRAGDDSAANRAMGHVISGTADQLKALALSETTSVWGIKCVLLQG